MGVKGTEPGMGKESQPQDDSLCSLSPATSIYLLEESMAADHHGKDDHHQGTESGMGEETQLLETGMDCNKDRKELNKDDISEENEEEDDLWGLLRIEDNIIEIGELPVLTDNVVQVRPAKSTGDSSAHDASHVGDQSGGLFFFLFISTANF